MKKRAIITGVMITLVILTITGIHLYQDHRKPVAADFQNVEPVQIPANRDIRPNPSMPNPDARVNERQPSPLPEDLKESSQPPVEMQATRLSRFETMACSRFHVTSARIYDPEIASGEGPTRPEQPGEIWIRILPEDQPSVLETMEMVARFYQETVENTSPVNVVLWVGGHPRFQKRFY
ncbi:MAG: hypothetical protein ABIK15_20020 [Pseudomonadota bacterium]